MEKKIIEINGVKLEVDLRQATTVESYKIGDLVKVLIKEYSNRWKSEPGVIIGFDNFVNRPTIIIAYLKQEYNSATIEFCHYNSESKDIEICLANRNDISLEQGTVLELMDRKILEAEKIVQDLKIKKEYFQLNFSKYFSELNRQ